MSTAIEFNNISKQYRLGVVSGGTIRADFQRWWTMNIRRQEDPFLKVGETNDRSSKGLSEYVWALKDIDFKVEQGDVVGIIGKNGAGKSTLLKILSRVTGPTTGSIRARGRIGSLLEVGTGFHPEMTGRENIFLNGAILGMTKPEIARKLDEIVDFSGCERYIDTPVKRYSSGMMVRLGFAVAAHLDPEILVVDEVLAVGDAEFQKKAIGKMQDVSKGEGRTVLFVSHNMQAVKALCKTGVVLKNGCVDYSGGIQEAVEHYLCGDNQEYIKDAIIVGNRQDNDSYRRPFEFERISILNENVAEIANDEPIDLLFRIRHNNKAIKTSQFSCIFINAEGVRVSYFVSPIVTFDAGKDEYEVHMQIGHPSLTKGVYTIRLEAGLRDFTRTAGCDNYDAVENVVTFNIKYMHKDDKDEILFWNNSWGCRFDSLRDVQIDVLQD